MGSIWRSRTSCTLGFLCIYLLCVETLLDNSVVERGKSDTYTITMEITSYITPPHQPLTTPTSRLRAQSGLSPSEGKSLSIDPPYPGNELATEFPSTDEVFENRYGKYIYHGNSLLIT